MGINGYASVTLSDNGGASVVVPGQSLQLVIGCSSAGTVGQLVATRSALTLNNTFSWGPLPEAASLTCAAGGTVLAIRATSTTAGSASTVHFTGSGTSVITVTGTPFDTYYFKYKAITGGTIAVAGIQFQVSLDAGRTFSPTINLGTANTYAVPGTGVTLNFGAGTVVAGDAATFGTVEPMWNDAGILAALTAYANSPYAFNPIGSIHIVGGAVAGGAAGADATAIGGNLEGAVVGAAAINPLFNSAILSARDASPATIWGGTGETDGVWSGLIETDYSAVAQKRIAACAAYWNMPSGLTNPLGMAPRFRRSVAYAVAARTVQIQPQRSWGRVKDGPLANIVVDPVNDPSDGFVYHNDATVAPAGLGDFRFVTTTLRSGKQGVFIRLANTMAVTGSQYSSWPLIAVADFAATILQQVGTNLINDNVRILQSGAIDPRDAVAIQNGMKTQLDAQMTNQQMVSSTLVVVDQTINTQLTGAINYTATLTARQVVLQINGTLTYSNPTQG